jgi:hypothetical protein
MQSRTVTKIGFHFLQKSIVAWEKRFVHIFDKRDYDGVSCIGIFVAIMQEVSFFFWSNVTPSPLPGSCPPDHFSEGRAFKVVEKLANELPYRQVRHRMYHKSASQHSRKLVLQDTSACQD